MDPVTLILSVMSVFFAGGGIWTLLSARASAKATREAAHAAAESSNQQAATADWTGLMAYWQAEMKAIREDNKNLEVRLLFLEQQRREDLDHIEALEHHIWQELPPPPPMRRRNIQPPNEAP